MPALEKVIEVNPESTQFHRDAIWVATRIDDPEARRFVRSFVNNKELSVKLAALHSVGLYRDAKALPALLKIVAKNHPAAQRQAATALGRIKSPEAIEPIMEAIKQGGDRFLEHALIYALIQINQRDKTAEYLNDFNPLARRAALIALDQMPNGNLTREELARQLYTGNKELARTALDIVASRPKWAGEIVDLLRKWLAAPDPDALPRDNLRGLLLALSKESAIQEVVAQSLRNPKTARSIRLLLIETMGQAAVAKLPPAWLDELGKVLDHADAAVVQQGIAAIRARNLTQFDAKLDGIVHDTKRIAETRVQAFGVVASRANVDEPAFAFLVSQLKADGPPLSRLTVAKGFSQAKLEDKQRMQLTKIVASAGALELPALLSAFEKNRTNGVGQALLDALATNPSLVGLTPAAIEKAFEGCAEDVRKGADKLTAKLQVDAGKPRERLDELMPLTKGGSLEQGRDIYFGNNASCSACHAINNRGGGVGPDLGKIGAIRSGRDLLESIVFSSASFARGFEPYVVETKAGKTHTGILARESTDAIYLLTTERVEIRIGREEIETFLP